MAGNSVNKVSGAPVAASSTPSNRPKQAKTAVEIKEASRAGHEAVENVIAPEGAENVEASIEAGSERVSERVSEMREKKGDGSGAGDDGQKVDPTDPVYIKAQLMKNLPSDKVMRRQVEAEIKKEISVLHKRAMKMLISPRDVSFFEMNNLMKKVRVLKGLLANLMKLSLDNLKTMWLRFVHGIM